MATERRHRRTETQGRLRDADYERIRALWAEGGLSAKALGRLFGIHWTHIYRVLALDAAGNATPTPRWRLAQKNTASPSAPASTGETVTLAAGGQASDTAAH
jgi:hypothetical protein